MANLPRQATAWLLQRMALLSLSGWSTVFHDQWWTLWAWLILCFDIFYIISFELNASFYIKLVMILVCYSLALPFIHCIRIFIDNLVDKIKTIRMIVRHMKILEIIK